MELADICQGYHLDLNVDRERTRWDVGAQNLREFYKELDRIFATLKKAESGERLSEDEKCDLRYAEDIRISIDPAKPTEVSCKNHTNPLYIILEDHLTQMPFVRLEEYGARFLSCVRTGRCITKLEPNQFDNFLLLAAGNLYGHVIDYHHAQTALRQEVISSEDEIKNERTAEKAADVIGDFTTTFPSCAVIIFGKDGMALVDEMDSHIRGEAICNIKEKQFKGYPFVRAAFNMQEGLESNFPGASSEARLTREELLKLVAAKYKIPLIDFLTATEELRYC